MHQSTGRRIRAKLGEVVESASLRAGEHGGVSHAVAEKGGQGEEKDQDLLQLQIGGVNSKGEELKKANQEEEVALGARSRAQGDGLPAAVAIWAEKGGVCQREANEGFISCFESRLGHVSVKWNSGCSVGRKMAERVCLSKIVY
ncbi:hypothetical protein GOP47_0028071 [Adiantum capillus-veneris]|nr:hypothetical protein GOP47_0028071 [Adiantum capillus-veneris]